MNLAELRDKLLRTRTRDPVSLEFPVEGAQPIEAECGYFQVRVAEMYLEYERKLLQKLAPATLCVCDFKYGADSKEVRVPFFVSNQMFNGVTEGGGNLDKVRIRLLDTRVLGPVPFRGGEVGVFAGLYRTVIEDERKAMFSLFDKLLGVAHAGSFVPYVQMAEKISDELSALLGMEAVKCIVAERRVFRREGEPLKSGYVALLACEAPRLAGVQLAIEKGLLRIVGNGASRAFDLCDFCLLRIDTSDTRDDVTTLPFHQKWKQARASLLAEQPGPARASLVECQRLLLDSEDLTEDHKNKLLEFYQAAFLKEQRRLEDAPVIEHRGIRSDMAVAEELQKLARLGGDRPRLAPAFERIRTLVDAPSLPPGTDDAQDDVRWEQAIRQHLREAGAPGTRDTAAALASTLADAMVAPRMPAH